MIQMKKMFILGLVLALSFSLTACSEEDSTTSGTAKLSGKIENFERSQTNLTVKLNDNSVKVSKTGGFKFNNLNPGNYTLEIIHEDGAKICSEQINIKEDVFKRIDLNERILRIQEKNANKFLVSDSEVDTQYLDDGYSEGKEREAKEGEIWVTLDQKTAGFFRHGHAAIAVDGYKTIESFLEDGVRRYYYDWNDRYDSRALVKVGDANSWDANGAVEESEKHIGAPFIHEI